MPLEIERKFLVKTDTTAWRQNGELLAQGYLSTAKERTVRVRVRGERGFLTIKGASRGAVRTEFEYEIPHAHAMHMLEKLCLSPLIKKTRYHVRVDEHLWEIDDFHGVNAGLVLAEIELQQEDETFLKPHWVGEEVTHDARYFNSRLIQCPYTTWPQEADTNV